MGASLIPMADQVQANTAGQTQAAPAPATAAPVQFSEILNGIGTEYGGLANLFHGEAPAQAVTTALDTTTATVGRFGGLVPEQVSSLFAPGAPVRNDSVNDPGVAQQTMPGQVAADVAAVPGGYPPVASGVATGIARAVSTVRSFLGMS